MAICKVCGLPKELCVCGAMAKEAAKIKVYTVRRSYGKFVTIVEGIEKDGKELTKRLKSKLACGGTFKGNKIELQGNHKMKMKKLLTDAGFNEDRIEVK